MHDHSVGLGKLHAFGVDLIARKSLSPLLPFALLTHGRPYVGIDYVGILYRLFNAFGDGELTVCLCPLHYFGIGLIALGTGYGKGHARLDCAYGETICHIVSVADESHLQALERPLVFAYRHQIGKHLAGVGIVGKSVDDGDGAVFCKVFHLFLLKRPYHYAIEIARKHPCSVLHGLTAAYLQIVA